MANQFQIPSGIFERIITRIKLEQKAVVLRRRFVFAAILFLSALASTIPMWQAFWSDLSASGFAQYSSLMIYDFKVVLAHWQDFGLSLLESFPVVSAIGLSSVIFIMLLALSFGSKFIKGFRKQLLIN